MSTVRVQYHREPEGWWAESPDLEGFVASGSTVGEVRRLVHEGVPFYLQEDDVEIEEIGDHGSLVLDLHLSGEVLTQVQTNWAPATDHTSTTSRPIEGLQMRPSPRSSVWT